MRIQEAKNKHLCLNCLRPGHSNQFCRLNGCKKCNRKHNTLVHLERSYDKSRAEVEESPSHNEGNSSETQVTACNLNSSAQQAILSTAIVLVKDNHDKFHEARVFLDCGSQSNFITMNLCTKLGLPKKKVEFSVEGVGQSLTSIDHSTTVSLRAKFGNFVGDVSCLIIPKITGPIPSESFEGSQLSIPNNIKLADPNFHCKGEIDILIGARHFWNLLCVGQIELGRNLPLLQKTKLGWVVAGGSIPNAKYNYSYCTVSKNMRSKTNSDIDVQLAKFWHIEEYTTNKKKLSKDEQFCEDHFMNTHTKNVEGRFIVSMPLRKTDTISVKMLGNSKNIALKRFYAMEKKLNRGPTLKSQYVQFMDDYENLGHMHEISENSSDLFNHTDQICYYLPHHAVIKEASLTTKLRVVFDASMKTDTGLSLNDVQYVGPTVQDDLISIILRFRKYRFVISGDVSKMYRQILITESEWPLQRIWWRKEPFERLKCFELNTVTFGTASAPFLATRCLRQLANENESSVPLISRVIREDFYMDDLLTGADCIHDLLKIQAGVHSILFSAGFELRKYRTNNLAIQNAIKVHSEIECSILDLGDSHNKTLGIMWNSEQDYIQYSIKVTMGPVTKRTILSTIAKIYDPLGLLGPVVVLAKMIMQQLWQAKLSWDEGIPQNIQTSWIKFRDNLYSLNEINIPRWVLSSNYIRIELHAFSDASESAYGVCVYLRCEKKDGSYETSLLCAKSRVAPIKKVSLPRLELCGAYELAHLVTKVRSAMQIKFNACYYWTDSTITLCWIKSDSSKWKTFVALWRIAPAKFKV